MAIADALRRGIPVVASRVGGIPQTVAGAAQPSWCHRVSRRRWPRRCGDGCADPRLRERLTERCAARQGAASRAGATPRTRIARDAGGGAMSDVIPVSVRVADAARGRRRALAIAGARAAQAARMMRAPLVVHDLGSGTGSMMRWLAPLLPGPQTWVLHDWNARAARARGASELPSTRTGHPAAVRTSVEGCRLTCATATSPGHRSSRCRRCSTCSPATRSRRSSARASRRARPRSSR